jgi:hypothetical protein
MITLALDQKQHNYLRQLAITSLGDNALSDLKIRRILIKYLRNYRAKSNEPPPLLTNYTHPKDYELFMFGAFLITGEDEYLQKIIDIIDGTKNFQNQKIIQETKEELYWLAYNDLIHEILSKAIKSRSESTRKELEKILKTH